MNLHPGSEKGRTGGLAELEPIRRALQENEDWYRDIVEHSQDLLCIHDLEGRLLAVNPAPARVLGYSVKELLGIPMREMIAPEFRSDFDAYLSEIRHKGESRGLLTVTTRSGERRIWEYHNTLRTEGVAKPIVRGTAHDVTEQKRAEKLLRDTSEELLSRVRENELTIRELKLFRTLVDHSNDAIKVIEPETLRFLDANLKACSELGYSREELLSLRVFDIDPAATESSAAKVKEQLRKTGSIVMEAVHRRKDGITFPVEVSMQLVLLDREYIVAIVHNLTERKQAESLLRASEERYRAVHDCAPVGICWTETPTGRFLGVNPKYCEIVGRTERELLGLTFQNITHPDDVRGDLARLRELVEGGGRHYVVEKRYIRPDGSIRWVEVEVVAMWPEGEDPVWHMAIVQDITERKQAEEALRTSERQQHKIAKQLETERAPLIEAQAVAKVGSWETELPSLEITWSEQTHRIFETDPSHFHPRRPDFVKLIHPEDRTKVDAVFEASLEKSAPSEVEYRIVMADGRVKALEERWKVFRDKEGQPVRLVGTCSDITERKQAEEALRRSEENYRNFVSQSSEGIFREDMDAPVSIDLPEEELIRHILYGTYIAECNDALAAMYGLTSARELRGKRMTELLPPEDPRNIELIRGYIRSGFRVLDRESHEVDVHGNPKVFLNSMIGTVENGMLVRTWGIQRDITEKVRLEEARKRAEAAMAALVQVRADSSENFFNSMALELAKCLEADYTIIGELLEGEEGKVRTIGVCGKGVIAENFTRELVGTPCGLVIERGTSSYAAGVTKIFPRDFLLKQMKVEGYAGTPLRDSQGRTIGLMVALYTRPLAAAKFAEMILQLFSTRTAAEVERKRTEEALRQSEQRLRIALSGSPITVFNQDRDLRYTWMYNLQEGWTEQDYLGKTDKDIFGAEAAAKMVAIKRPVLETGRGTREEFTLTARGKTYYCDITVEPLIDAAGKVAGVNSACVDITHLHEMTEELRVAKEKLSEEKLYLEQAIDSELGFGEIIGRSGAIKEVMEKVGQVAPSDATVLLLGETGTGKELVARALHRLSNRQGNSFIKLNCAAIPSGLLESELFGHERGAFTGAVAKKIGRLELADQGTLFLDEIGEIPLDLQPKLLRVLQDQEFERLGGTQTLKVNFRLVAATNRNLLHMSKQGEFRSDLYYRLNVFPIHLPALRERREDIRLLIDHFVRKYALRMNKVIASIPAKTMEALVRWNWPGNIRELENLVERSVILTPGSVLRAPLAELHGVVEEVHGVTLRDKERERILRALRECHGQIGGANGAAARLGLKRTTLQSKMSKLGIKHTQ